jgi:hypothetical protein
MARPIRHAAYSGGCAEFTIATIEAAVGLVRAVQYDWSAIV